MPATPEKVQPSPKPVKLPPHLTHIPGERLLFCLDCKSGWDSRAGACPACGSRASLHVLRVLDRRSAA